MESLLLHGCSLALSTVVSSTVSIWCAFHVDYTALVTHTGVERHNAIRSRAQLAAVTQFYCLSFSGGPRSRCPYTDGVTVFCAFNTPRHHSRRLYATPHLGLSAVVFYQIPLLAHSSTSDFMKTSVKHRRPPATQETGRQSRSPMPPRSCLSPSSSSGASSPELLLPPPPTPPPPPSLPAQPYSAFKDTSTQASPHSAAFADAATQLPLTEFFLGCVYSDDSLDRQPSLPSHGNLSGAPLPHPKHMDASLHSCPTHAAQRSTTAGTGTRGSNSPELSPCIPVNAAPRATPVRNLFLPS